MLKKLLYVILCLGGLLVLVLAYLANTVINRPSFVEPGKFLRSVKTASIFTRYSIRALPVPELYCYVMVMVST